MTEKYPPSDGSHRTGDVRSRWERRKFLAIGGGVGATLFAGCTSDSVPGDDPDDGPDDGADDPDGESNFRLLVSDRPADIDDFDSLEVTFDSARVFQGGEETEDDEDETESDESTVTEDETETETDPSADDDGTAEAEDETENGDAGEDGDDGAEDRDDGAEDSDDGEGDDSADGEGDDSDDEGSRGYVEFDLDGPTVDLTEVVGEKAMAVTEGHLEAGTYQKLELHVSDVEGVVDGDEVAVKVPSEKLQLTKPFEVVAGETVDFVFDINVVKRGNQDSYNLKPVISKSGVVGQDVDEHEEVGEDDEGDNGDGDEGDNGDGDEGDESTDTEEETEEGETETASD